ncbi:hypothetical protein [Xanthomonas sp. 4461]|uniref:Uncharacterized protein n=1 Tax=Xanthomonas sp. 10-10 TaxID=3115848 RepID=A0AAU7P580_9XANT|nr:hypothetical protein [Xanthomonas sp. 4461]MCS3807744.1 basic membrane lipoprotein Med (substrate-binding protein (PBP1-ABC) superfamily) [Xanthomonas sp. 4461]
MSSSSRKIPLLAFGIIVSSTLITTASAKSLHVVSRTEQMTSFTHTGPSRTEVFNQQWADGAAQCRDAFPQTTSVQLGQVNTRAINAKTFKVTGKWICRG